MPETQDIDHIASTLDLIDKTMHLRERASGPAHECLRAALDDLLRRLSGDLAALDLVRAAQAFAKGDRVRVVGPPAMSATTGAHCIGRPGTVVYVDGRRHQIAFATGWAMVYDYEWYDASSLERLNP